MFEIKWLRNFIRRRTRPIPEISAAQWKGRLSIAYAILAWNAFGCVVYAVYNGKADWAKYHNLVSEEELKLTPAQNWTKTLGIRNATVYRVSGGNFSKYDVHNEFPENEKEQ